MRGWPKRSGYSVITEPGKADVEQDTFTCGHCNHVVFVKPRCDPADMGGRCTCCDRLICPKCVGHACDVIEKKLDRMEARGRLLEAMREE
jgi:hypothetical protein